VWRKYDINQLSLDDRSGGCTSARAMKCGLSITNTTPGVEIGGRISYVDLPNRIRFLANPAFGGVPVFKNIIDSIDEIAGNKNENAAEFSKTKNLYCHVVDHVRYMDFHEFRGADTMSEFFATMGIWPDHHIHDRCLSTLFVMIHPTTKSQTYTITAQGSYYTRWPMRTMQGQSQIKVPVSTIANVNAIHNHAESMSGVLHSASAVGSNIVSKLLPVFGDAAVRYATGGVI